MAGSTGPADALTGRARSEPRQGATSRDPLPGSGVPLTSAPETRVRQWARGSPCRASSGIRATSRPTVRPWTRIEKTTTT